MSYAILNLNEHSKATDRGKVPRSRQVAFGRIFSRLPLDPGLQVRHEPDNAASRATTTLCCFSQQNLTLLPRCLTKMYRFLPTPESANLP
jgi:hypothetical protein